MTAPDGYRPRDRLALVPADQRTGLGGIVIGVANAGRPVKVGVDLVGMRQHMHILGPTGTGKSSLQVRMILEDASGPSSLERNIRSTPTSRTPHPR